MRLLSSFTFILISLFSLSQEWHSFEDISGKPFQTVRHIKNDPNTNSTLLYGIQNRIILVKDDGTGKYYSPITTHSPNAQIPHGGWMTGAIIDEEIIYYTNDSYGLYQINTDTDLINEINSIVGFRQLLKDEDSIWVSATDIDDGLKFVNQSADSPFELNESEGLIKFKNNIYAHTTELWSSGISFKRPNNTIDAYREINSDILSDYIYDFTVSSGSSEYLWVATKEGLSQFNGTNFINYTPDTHPEMPYKTVERIAYDNKNGKVWMILADTNGDAKTLTSYNGSWETYDSSNSPINFSFVQDITVDTLGQVWVAESAKVHVLSATELQGWLGVEKQEKQKSLDVSVYPNPTSQQVHFRVNSNESFAVEMYDISGKLVASRKGLFQTFNISLPDGVYHYKLTTEKGQFTSGKVIVVK